MAQLTIDAAIIAKEAANFDRIAAELKNAVARVESTAAELNIQWKGLTADAAQHAMRRYQAAGADQINVLNDISTNIQTASAQYSATDEERAATLAAAMGMNGDDGKKHDGVQLVDWKQAPPPKPSPGHTAQDVRDAIKNLPKGTAPFIKEVHSEQDLRNLWNWASADATERTGSGYPGTERVLRDGTIIGIRESGGHGSTMDIRTPDNAYVKVHINTARGAVPEIPVRGAGAPEGAAPGSRAPVESPPVERAPVEPPPARPGGPVVRPPGGFGGAPPLDPNSVPHPIHLPHSHHGPPVLGRDDVADLPEFDPG